MTDKLQTAANGSFQEYLKNKKGLLEGYGKKILTPGVVVKLLIGMMSKNPKLAKCSNISLFNCLTVAVDLGLRPGGPRALIHFVPYAGVATPIIDYRGLIAIAKRGGNWIAVTPRTVRAKDEFSIRYGTDEGITHIPCSNPERGKIVGFYTIAKNRNGIKQFEYMTVEDVNLIRKRSPARDNGPWVTDYEMMGRKTVIKRLCNLIDDSQEMQKAIEIDNNLEMGKASAIDAEGFVVTPEIPGESVTDRTKRKLKGVIAPPPPGWDEKEDRQPGQEG